ncbi:MAG: family 20 glycosylhydrolase [Candidatus Cryptobacteroides sp.]
MKTGILLSVALTAISLFQAIAKDATEIGSPSAIIPRPTEFVMDKGVFTLTETNEVYIKNGDKDLISTILDSGFGISGKSRNAKIEIIVPSPKIKGDEAYSLVVSPKKIIIEARTSTGAFYGWQSLLQMLRFGNGRDLQCCHISDSPRYGWRGLHFDVSRHFRSKEFLMKQMDAMSMFKMNKAHLHLTDAAGWRLQINAYPLLSGKAAWRPQKKWEDWNLDRAYVPEGSAGAYGGYYTKDDIREIVEYARQRHIEVIPEIEMPGHSEEVTAVYPWLSCNGKPSDLCPGNEKTFEFLEKVLDETMEIFPSEYIHIGGDEAGKDGWKSCPLCRKRMEEEGLDNVDELQSYLIRRIEAYVNSKGRKIIGWDEILSGGLAPNATVMSWRGTEGGVKAISEGHDVIMAPGKYCYLDYCQDAPFKEPRSMGGYTPLDSVYVFNPDEVLDGPDGHEHLLGVQACLWTEFITEDSHCEYMYWPRAIAIAETGWTAPEKKDAADFRKRVSVANKYLTDKGYRVFDLDTEYGQRRESFSEVTNLAKGGKVTYNTPAHRNYPSSGDTALIDGVLGGWTYGDKKWQGFHSDIDLIIDLGEIKDIHYAGAVFMQSKSAWVYVPEEVEFLVSKDGVSYSSVAKIPNDVSTGSFDLIFKTYGSTFNASARYIRIRAVRGPMLEWLFTDEIVVN